ncbi:MAG: ABC transporter permease [Spirochaetales bacterium]|nr:ABC transporter permease [Spirochaetales bacterium]
MVIIKLAVRTLLRRKRRMISIGILVFAGTLLLVFGETFAQSAVWYSKESIINNFTGDLIVYSEKSKEQPSPFAFTTPLPVIGDIEKVTTWLTDNPQIDLIVPIAQNYSILSVERNNKKIELPLIYYAVDPVLYQKAFDIVRIQEGSYFNIDQASGTFLQGIVISQAQNERYRQSYDVTLLPGEKATFLGITPGGSVNAVNTEILGIFEPALFKNIFDYINFVDITSYAQLYNFTGVKTESLPDSYEKAFSASGEDDIFALAEDTGFDSIDVDTLESEVISGYTMIAVKLRNHETIAAIQQEIEAAGLGVSTAPWDQASGFFAPIARSLNAVIYTIVALIFLIVSFIFMNTLIINIIERTHEIGTMRALGSEKSFIRNLFLSETLVLNLFFGGLGIAAAFLLTVLLGPSGVPLPDIVSQYLIGGGNLPLLLNAKPFIEAIAVVVIVSILATLYPIRVATKISPLQAMLNK